MISIERTEGIAFIELNAPPGHCQRKQPLSL